MKSKILALSRNEEFKNLLSKNKLSNRYTTIFFGYLNNKNNKKFNISFVAKKKIGNAVKRNYLKRIFRTIVRNNWKSIKNSISFEIIPKKKILNYSFTEIEKDIRETLNK